MSSTPVPALRPAVRAVLRSPDQQLLLDDGAAGFTSADGRSFPMTDGILCLLHEAERGADLGDARFYDTHPFGEWAPAGDSGAGVESELKDLLRGISTTALVLDVGSGAGRISNYLSASRYGNAVSLDFSLNSLRQVRAHATNACIWGNNLALPFATGVFQLVISSGVAHHTPDPRRAIEECIRVLAPGGWLYLRVYNRHSLYHHVHATYGALLRSLYAHRATQPVAEWMGFGLYRRLRHTVLRRPDLEERLLRAKFGNLFCKPLVYFFARDELEALLAAHQLEIVSSAQQGTTHRMLCYVARKPARDR